MKKRKDAVQIILEIEEDPALLDALTSREARSLIRKARCPCLNGEPPEGVCTLTKERTDEADCKSYKVIFCPNLITLVEDAEGELVETFDSRQVVLATKFYRGFTWVYYRQ